MSKEKGGRQHVQRASAPLLGGGQRRLEIVETPHFQDLQAEAQGPAHGLCGREIRRGLPRVAEDGHAGELGQGLLEQFHPLLA